MVLEDIGEVIAERVLHRAVNGESPKDVIVRLGKPQPHSDGSGFFSPFELIGLGQRKVRYASGIDAFHALQLVFRMISVDLDFYKQEPSVDMYFLQPGDDLGVSGGAVVLKLRRFIAGRLSSKRAASKELRN